MALAGCTLLWLIYGIWQWRRGHALLARMQGIAPTKRQIWGTTLIFGSTALLLIALALLSALGNGSQSISWWQWIAVAVAGLGFVHCQSTAAAMLLSLSQLGVTRPGAASSTSRGVEHTQQ